MSALTTRLALYKPGGGLSGLILPDEVADIDKINGNMDKIDAAIGGSVVTSVSRPPSPFDGQIIQETDTRNAMIYSSSATRWLPMGSTPNAASQAIRDALYPAPVDGNRVYRTDMKYVEQYYPTGAVVAGWYPANGSSLGCYMSLAGTVASVGAQANFLMGGGAEISDLWSWHDPATNTDRITPNRPGMYRVAVTLAFFGNATGARIASLLKNGSLLIDGRINNPDATNSTTISLTYTVMMNGTTDYLGISYLQNCGGPLNTIGFFSVEYVIPNN